MDELFENCEVYADSENLNGIIAVSDETEPYNPIKYYAIELYYALKAGMFLINEDRSLKTLWNFIRARIISTRYGPMTSHRQAPSHRLFCCAPLHAWKGVASKLMNAVLKYADENKLIMSLETHNEKNVSLYEHYGFHLFEVVQAHFALKQFCWFVNRKAAAVLLGGCFICGAPEA